MTTTVAVLDQPMGPAQPRIWRIVLYLLVARTVVATTRRFVYPFLPTFADRLGTSISSVQGMIALQNAAGLTSPLFGPLPERFGRKRAMLGALLIMLAAALLVVAMPKLAIFGAALMVMGLAKNIFDPSMQAYIADRVPFAQRGRAVGAVEVSWSLSLLVGAALASVAFALDGISTLFMLLAALIAAVIMVLWTWLPDDTPTPEKARAPITPRQTLYALKSHPSAWLALAFALLVSAPSEMILVSYAAWMEGSLGLSLAIIGLATLVISAAEGAGEVLMAIVADRIGLRRIIIATSTLAALGYGAMAILPLGIVGILALLFLAIIGIEMTLVAVFALYTEVMPDARAIMMSTTIAAMSGGRFAGAFLGGLIYATLGFGAVGIVALLMGLVAVGLILRLRV